MIMHAEKENRKFIEHFFLKLLLLDIFTADVIVRTWCVEQQANKEHRGSVIGRRMGEILKQEKKNTETQLTRKK